MLQKGFDSDFEDGAATILPTAYTDAAQMPESTAGGKKKKKKATKANNLAMA